MKKIKDSKIKLIFFLIIKFQRNLKICSGTFLGLLLCDLALSFFFCFLLEGLNRLVFFYFEIRLKSSQSNKLIFVGKVVKIIPWPLS